MSTSNHEEFMRLALAEAHKAALEDEVPVGAVVTLGNEVLAKAYDLRQHSGDPIAHAELLAIRQAALRLGDWRLEQCTLYVTLEPCPMCTGALIMSRLKLLVYGAANLKAGSVTTKCHLLDSTEYNHKVEVVSGVLAEECAALLAQFFSAKRR